MKRSRGRFLADCILEFCVLPHLPVKSLIRFKCVSKRWYNLISNNQFILQQNQDCKSLRSLNFVGLDHLNGWRIHVSRSIQRDPSSVCFRDLLPNLKLCQIIDSCNGLMAISCELQLIPPKLSLGKQTTLELFVGNPVYQDWKWIPKSRYSISSWTGLVFDPEDSVGHYQLVHPIIPDLDSPIFEACGFTVFSSETGKWVLKPKTRLPFLERWVTDPACLAHPACVRGALYWLVENHHVLWYDTKKECSGLLPVPVVSKRIGRIRHCDGGSLNESNGQITYTRAICNDIEIWSMKNFQWTMSYHIQVEEIVQRIPQTFDCYMNLKNDCGTFDVTPVASEGKVVIFMIDGTPYGYDAGIGEATRYPTLSSPWSHSLLYKASLIPTPGQQQLFPPEWERIKQKREGYVSFKCSKNSVLKISTTTVGNYQL